MSTTTFSPTASRSGTYAGTTEHAGATGDRVTWSRGLAVGVVAAVAATAVAAAFRAAGHPLAVTDGPIPLLAFGQMVLIATVIGIVVARHTSRTTFFRVTVALTALSCVPDLVMGNGPVSTAGLMLTHVVAAAIIVPRLARR